MCKKKPVNFVVLSDMHFGITDYFSELEVKNRKILRFLRNNYKFNALITLGDNASDGKDWQYDVIKKVFNDEIFSRSEMKDVKFISTPGNHDNVKNFFEKMDIDSSLQGYNIFNGEKTNGEPVSTFDTWVDGVHFICFCHDRSAVTDETYTWLDKTLSQSSLGEKSFVLMHYPYSESDITGGAFSNSEEFNKFRRIILKYPKAIVVHGHTHRALNLPFFAQKKGGYIAINASTTANVIVYGANYVEHNTRLLMAYGLYFSVTDNSVTVRRIDLEALNELEPLVINSENPLASIYDDITAPYFPENSKINVTDITDRSITLNFPAAIDDTKVTDYLINIKGQSERTFCRTDWFNQDPPEINYKISGLTPSTAYEIAVTPVDAYKNYGETLFSNVITLDGKSAEFDILNMNFSHFKGNTCFDDSPAQNNAGIEGKGQIIYAEQFGKNALKLSGYPKRGRNNSIARISEDTSFQRSDSFLLKTEFLVAFFDPERINVPCAREMHIVGNMEDGGFALFIDIKTQKLVFYAVDKIAAQAKIEPNEKYKVTCEYIANTHIKMTVNGEEVIKPIDNVMPINNLDLIIGGDIEAYNETINTLEGLISYVKIKSNI